MAFLITIFFSFLPFFPVLSVRNPLIGGANFGFDLPLIRLFALVIFVVWFLRGLFKKDLFIPINFLSIALCSFLFIAGVSGFWAFDKEAWARKFIFLLNVFLLYFPLCQFFQSTILGNPIPTRSRTPEPSANNPNALNISNTIKAVFYSGAAISLIGIFQFLAQFIMPKEDFLQGFFNIFGPIFYGSNLQEAVLEYPSFFVSISGNDYLRAFGFFTSPQNFALFVGIILFLSFIIKDRIAKPVFYTGISLMALAILFTLSRGAFVSFLATLTVLITLKLVNKIRIQKSTQPFNMLPRLVIGANINTINQNSKNILRTTLIIVAVIAVFILLFSPFTQRFIDISSTEDTSRSGRIELWQKSFLVFKENPFVGVGLGSLPIYIEPDKDLRAPVNAHNTYLEVAAELGLTGLIAFILIFLPLLYDKITNYACFVFDESKRKLRITENNFPCILYSIFYILIFSVFETTIYFFPAMAVLILIFAVANFQAEAS